MTRIAAVRGALPRNRYSQAEVTDMAAHLCLPEGADRRLLDRLHAGAQVEFRNLVLPLDQYAKLDGFGMANDTFIEAAIDLGAEAIGAALDAAGLAPSDVDMIMMTSVTGVAAPSVDARLVGRLGLRPDIMRGSLGLELPDRRPRRYGLRQHYQIAPWTDFVEVHWAAGGEAYVTPVGENLVGVAVLSSQRCTYQTHLAQFPALRARLEGPAVTRVRGAGPLRQRVRSRVAGRVLLVGDAAGYTDALTGEGVTLALRSAQALVRCLQADRPQTYESAWRSLSWRHRLLTGALLQARRHPTSARLIVPAAQHLPALFTVAVRALA